MNSGARPFGVSNAVGDYVSAHTFLTGVRGLLACFSAFYEIESLSMPPLGIISAGMIVVTSVLLLVEPKVAAEADVAKPEL